MRTSFELKFTALNYQSAIEATAAHIGRFLNIDPEEVPERVDTELKVELNDGKFEVTAFGKLKTNFVLFGFDKHK